MVHDIDLIVWILGPIVGYKIDDWKVKNVKQNKGHFYVELEANDKKGNTIPISIEHSKDSSSYLQQLSVNKKVVVNHDIPWNSKEKSSDEQPWVVLYEDAYREELKEFYSRIKNGWNIETLREEYDSYLLASKLMQRAYEMIIAK